MIAPLLVTHSNPLVSCNPPNRAASAIAKSGKKTRNPDAAAMPTPVTNPTTNCHVSTLSGIGISA
jgi:hypothetical protein